MSNLNPVWSIGFQVKEAIRANGIARDRGSAKARTIEVLQQAGLADAEKRLHQFPHQFSGGMRQRALIGIGLAADPKLLIADEPTSALDVTVQRVILDHMASLTRDKGTSMLLITHDLGLAAGACEQDHRDERRQHRRGRAEPPDPREPSAPLHEAPGRCGAQRRVAAHPGSGGGPRHRDDRRPRRHPSDRACRGGSRRTIGSSGRVSAARPSERSTMCRTRSPEARRSLSWANRAPASPRWRRWC